MNRHTLYTKEEFEAEFPHYAMEFETTAADLYAGNDREQRSES